ncbi:transcription repressor NadR [Thermovenabulum gondwanense]|uniref:Putative transcription repressor NiaR n=1 Tax=Thermovenabulum gondwanense TaxID=520767 RepID=A0A162MDA4_9FIRM|nr:transcription repressor NadR [Thermovenabulum gondwanense]KYO65362.1 putative transcription repressor NiaR [Thermovenabulum gondwanense]
MNAEERREKIVEVLEKSKKPIPGNELAKLFNVTRQVIVQDIAILRASGKDILSTSSGYMIESQRQLVIKKVACRHTKEELRDELMTFVECGCKVVDVIVEHPIYGELHGLLMISNSKDVENFLKNLEEKEASLLSELTGGIHLHTIEAINEDAINKAKSILKEKGILLE